MSTLLLNLAHVIVQCSLPGESSAPSTSISSAMFARSPGRKWLLSEHKIWFSDAEKHRTVAVIFGGNQDQFLLCLIQKAQHMVQLKQLSSPHCKLDKIPTISDNLTSKVRIRIWGAWKIIRILQHGLLGIPSLAELLYTLRVTSNVWIQKMVLYWMEDKEWHFYYNISKLPPETEVTGGLWFEWVLWY